MTEAKPDHILLVDDDPEILWGVGRCLTRAGFEVTTCGDGAEAIPLLENGRFDLLVTDVQMPELNGLALIDWAREHRPAMRVIVITAYGSAALKQLSLRKGVVQYFEKPLDPNLLIELLGQSNHGNTFSGSIDEIDLFEYLQLLALSKRSVRIEVTSRANERISLYIRDGKVLHANSAEIEGESAFYRCLSFAGGTFVTKAWQDPTQVSIDKPCDFLLMEAARLKDEAARDANPAPESEFDDAFGETFGESEEGTSDGG